MILFLLHLKNYYKYHIVFEPKFRRQVIYGKIKVDIGVILKNHVIKKVYRTLC